METLVVVKSIHHKNTEKIAKVLAEVLNAEIKTPEQVEPSELEKYSLIGFGSGIYSDKHHKSILNLAEGLAQVTNKKAFIFSTSAMMGEDKVAKDHSILRRKLRSKGYIIVDEFSCKGFNTNSFLKYFGGMNKGRPNTEDLKKAKQFGLNLKKNLSWI